MQRARGLTRVVVVEDHLLFAESLEVALTMEGHELHCVSLRPDVTSATLLGEILRARPRVVLLDLDLGLPYSGLGLIGPLTAAGAAVVVVTGSRDPARWGECLRYGARTVLAKRGSLDAILAAIRRIGEGRSLMPREERERLLAHYHADRQAQHDRRIRLESLTGREGEVLGSLMAGHAVRDIARQSVVSEATVRTQVKSILAKLGVSSQLAAVGVAHGNGWRPPSQRHREITDFGHAEESTGP